MTSDNRGVTTPVTAELSTAQPHFGEGVAPPAPPNTRPNRKSTVKCRYFGTKKGCRAGDSCTYFHDTYSQPLTGSLSEVGDSQQENQFHEEHKSADEPTAPSPSFAGAFTEGPPSQRVEHVAQSKSVPKPVPKAQKDNPREFQINQIRRKFNPVECSDHNGTRLQYTLFPTDPDFHFDLKGLEIALYISHEYPSGGSTPVIEVLNESLDMEAKRRVQERFVYLVEYRPSGTLLSWMNLLDRQLEDALTSPPPDTSTPATASHTLPILTKSSGGSNEGKGPNTKQYGAQDGAQRRQREITQFASRLKRDPLFRGSPDGVSFTVPVTPARLDLLPMALHQVKTVNLVVPHSYPKEPCRISMSGINDESARAVETAFTNHELAHPSLSIMANLNYLATMMHKLAAHPLKDDTSIQNIESGKRNTQAPPEEPSPVSQDPPTTRVSENVPSEEQLEDRPHIHVIPRPPEWSTPNDGDETDSEMSEESWSDGSYSENESAGGVPIPTAMARNTGRRVLMSLPHLDLHGVELLAVANISVTLKCERCKDLADVKNVKIGDDGVSQPAIRSEVCQKCSSYLRIGFVGEFIHSASNDAGTLYLDGCTAVDLLPGTSFIPTCAECSTSYPHPGVAAIRGDHKMAHCRECHNRMAFKIPELKFLLVTAGPSQGRSRASRKPRESLGIVAGQELPRRGRCSHYGRSYRWFRFGCCSRVFPCDKCHDAASDHPNEHANRMICGACSREQIYRPESCGICHSVLVRKPGTGFWEGGRGTRSKALMSRKDPRKYKRRGGTAVGRSQKK